ncbi:hypothetical protein HNQ56_003739 [Anaerotaenia torta]|uniref:minor capsid protein n=1 Tax=Anaerotaenia torta TaxID=433293 RepID=UPI003D24B30D
MGFDGRLELKPTDAMLKARGLEPGGRVQKFVDQECIRLMAPYTPFLNGELEKSATQSTIIGSGEVKQDTPYARYQYYGEIYGPSFPIYENGQLAGFRSPKGLKKHPTGRPLQHNTAFHPQAGPFWFERMKADHKDNIREGAEKVAGVK